MTTKSLGHVQEILNQRSGDLEAVMRCLPHPPVVVCTPALLSRLMTDTPPDFCARDLGKFWMALSWHLHAATNPAHADKVVKIDHRYYTMQSKAGDMVEWLRAQEIAVLSLMHLQQSDSEDYPSLEACSQFISARSALCPTKHATARLAYWSETVSNGLGAATSMAVTVPASSTKADTSG